LLYNLINIKNERKDKMKEILNYLFEHKTLAKTEAKQVLSDIGNGRYNNSQIAAFMTVYIMRSITVDEIEGFRDAMLELCIPLDFSAYDPIDLCGTGGDNKDTFNISTLSSFVVAGCGVKVAKHGNYGVSSTCGSSNVLEHLGHKFTNDKDILERNLNEAGICFLHAPLFHPAMKFVGPIRKELGIKTFFNMLGPIINPSFPKKQLIGVFSLELARLYAYLHQKTNKQFMILHSLDGYDEISLTGPFKAISNTKEQILSPENINMKTLHPGEIAGGTNVAESAKIFTDILIGAGTEAQNQVVIANSGMAVQCARPELNISDAMQMAEESLKSKKALKSLNALLGRA
jgi:anthranilate phosphoribosyltransferase